MAVNMFQERVAVNRVHECVELSCESYFVAAGLDLEVGNLGSTCDIDVLEKSTVFSFGGQRPANAAIDTQVRAIEGVLTGNRSFSGIAFEPDAKLSAGCDLAWRFRIVKFQIIINGIDPLNVAQQALMH